MPSIRIENLTKRFGPVLAVDNLSLDIADKEFVSLLGPSGCGKTTTLRLLAGFMPPDAGSIYIGDQLLSSPKQVVQPERRHVSMVFQDYAVWPHKTVFENVAFGLEIQRLPRAEIRRRVAEVLKIVGLVGLDDRYPSQLSGGQQQRVALARALVVEPKTLLLDEPLSNLDARLRERMRDELVDLQRRVGITFVYVTHDQAEAMRLSDRIAVLHGGRLQQFGTPEEIYARPRNRFVAEFMGNVNLLPGRVIGGNGETAVVALAEGLQVAVGIGRPAGVGEEVLLSVRPEDVALHDAPPRAVETRHVASLQSPTATVVDRAYLGNLINYLLEVGGLRLWAQAHPSRAYALGSFVRLSIAGDRCAVLPATGEASTGWEVEAHPLLH